MSVGCKCRDFVDFVDLSILILQSATYVQHHHRNQPSSTISTSSPLNHCSSYQMPISLSTAIKEYGLIHVPASPSRVQCTWLRSRLCTTSFTRRHRARLCQGSGLLA